MQSVSSIDQLKGIASRFTDQALCDALSNGEIENTTEKDITYFSDFVSYCKDGTIRQANEKIHRTKIIQLDSARVFTAEKYFQRKLGQSKRNPQPASQTTAETPPSGFAVVVPEKNLPGAAPMPLEARMQASSDELMAFAEKLGLPSGAIYVSALIAHIPWQKEGKFMLSNHEGKTIDRPDPDGALYAQFTQIQQTALQLDREFRQQRLEVRKALQEGEVREFANNLSIPFDVSAP